MINTYQLGDDPEFYPAVGRVAFIGSNTSRASGDAAGLAIAGGIGRIRMLADGASDATSSAAGEAYTAERLTVASVGLQYTAPPRRLHYGFR